MINKNALTVDSAVGTIDSFLVQSTVEWTASLSAGAEWLHIDKNSGTKGNTRIKLTVVLNDPTVLVQTATIKIAATNRNDIPSVTLTVTKKSITSALGFRKLLGGTKDESGSRTMAKTSDGGIILVGSTTSDDGDVHNHHGEADMWIVKLDARGDTIWTRTYGGSADDRGVSVVATSDGGFVVCGSTTSVDGDIHYNRGGSDAWLLKMDANGDTLWTKTYGGSRDERLNSIVTTNDGGYAIAGVTASYDGDINMNHGSGDFWVLKLNSVGDLLWNKTYGGSFWDEALTIIATADGGYALAGMTNSNDQDVTGYHVSIFTEFDMWILKLDATGNKLWAKALGGSHNDFAMSLVEIAGGFVITGFASSMDGDVTGNHGNTVSPFGDMWVIKINDTGSIVWAKTFGGSLDDSGVAINTTSDGGYVIAGHTGSKNGDVSGYHEGPGDDIWLVKLDANGALVWTKTLGGFKDEGGTAILPVSDGYIISGLTNSYDGDFLGTAHHGNYDLCVIKLMVH